MPGVTPTERNQQALAPAPGALAALAALRTNLTFMQMPQPCWVFDVASRAFLEVNPAAERVYGYSRAEFLRMTLADIRRPTEAARLSAFLDARDSGATAHVPSHWLHRTRHGEDFAVSTHAVDFPCGERSARMVFVTDLTLQRADAIENKLLYQCLESAGDMIVVTAADPDAAGNHGILYVNRAFEQRTGYTRAEVLGRDARLLQGPGTDRAAVARLRAALGSWQSVTVELRNYTRAGEPYWVEMTLTPVADERGWFHYWFSVERDISARKAAEQTLQGFNAALEIRVAERTRELQHTVHELEAFSRSVSHDLQNPLNGVRGFAEMLQLQYGPALPPEANHMLDLMQRSADQMHRMIEQLLALNRISSMQQRPVAVDLAGLCQDMLGELHRQEPGRQVQLATIESGLVHADLPLLVIVLQSLLDNAWKFTSRGPEPAVLQVTLRHAPDGVVLGVADNGIGFDPCDARALFRPFQRLPGARGFEGAGIGLARAARAADRLGGWLWAEGQPGRGACFQLYLPDAAVAPQELPTQPGALGHDS